MKTKQNQVNLSIDQKRLDAASENYRKLMHEVQPFIKKSWVLMDSTEGKWQDTRFVHKKQPDKSPVWD